LFTPPYHSDLQPIELAWALIKGRVGRQYSIETSLQMVYERLMHEFNEVQNEHETVLGMITKSSALAKKLFDQIVEEEEAEDEGDGSEDDSTDSDSDADEEADSESDEEAQLTQFVIHEI
jgi:hypothetical protein